MKEIQSKREFTNKINNFFILAFLKFSVEIFK